MPQIIFDRETDGTKSAKGTSKLSFTPPQPRPASDDQLFWSFDCHQDDLKTSSEGSLIFVHHFNVPLEHPG